jgi:hypothetical protein
MFQGALFRPSASRALVGDFFDFLLLGAASAARSAVRGKTRNRLPDPGIRRLVICDFFTGFG